MSSFLQNLANNSLGVRGAQLLGHVMVVNGNITHLNLSGLLSVLFQTFL